MSHFTPRRARPLTKPKVGSPSRRILVSALGLGLAAGAAIFGLAAAGPDETLARTGELNAMGLPVVETPEPPRRPGSSSRTRAGTWGRCR